MTIRAEGLRWFRERFGKAPGSIHVSRCFPPDKSWTKHAAWAFEIPPAEIGGHDKPDIVLICEQKPGSGEFSCLKVPAPVFLCCEPYLYTRPDNGHISLFLSAESADHLVEKRGSGTIRFAPFVWNGQFGS